MNDEEMAEIEDRFKNGTEIDKDIAVFKIKLDIAKQYNMRLLENTCRYAINCLEYHKKTMFESDSDQTEVES